MVAEYPCGMSSLTATVEMLGDHLVPQLAQFQLYQSGKPVTASAALPFSISSSSSATRSRVTCGQSSDSAFSRRASIDSGVGVGERVP